MLWQSMERIIATESLRSMYVSDYGNTSDENRKKMHRETMKTARPEYFIERAVTIEELMVEHGR